MSPELTRAADYHGAPAATAQVPDANPAASRSRRTAAPFPVKIIISGGFGVGKTTLIRTVSEIKPLTTEEYLTKASDGVDSLVGVERKTTTTVAADFGRLTFHQPLPMVLYMFGTPGQERFWFTWDDLICGAIGAVVLVDTRRLDASFDPIGYFEEAAMPFVVAINEFDGDHHRYNCAEVRDALAVPSHVPIVSCDARKPQSAITVLLNLVDHALTRDQNRPPTPQGAPS